MKKLFEMGSLLSIEDWSSIKILGGYELVVIKKDYVKLRKEGYEIELHAVDIEFDMLLEHSALVSFSSISELRIRELQAKGETDETKTL